MQKKFLFVINPISGGIDKKPLEITLSNWAKKNNVAVEKYFTKGENDLENLHELLEKESFTYLVAAGGDGTVKLVAPLVVKHDLILGILPAGSANGLATQFKISTNVNEALGIIASGETLAMDTLQFNGKELGLHISDAGLNANLVQHFENSEQRGFLSYADGVYDVLKEQQPFKVYIQTKDENIEEQVLMVAIANANRYGSGALLNKRGKINDGKFELCLLKDFEVSSIAMHFFDFINENKQYMQVIQCTEAEIRLEDEQPFQIDGELKGNVKHISVKISKNALKVIVPKEEKSFLAKLFT